MGVARTAAKSSKAEETERQGRQAKEGRAGAKTGRAPAEEEITSRPSFQSDGSIILLDLQSGTPEIRISISTTMLHVMQLLGLTLFPNICWHLFYMHGAINARGQGMFFVFLYPGIFTRVVARSDEDLI